MWMNSESRSCSVPLCFAVAPRRNPRAENRESCARTFGRFWARMDRRSQGFVPRRRNRSTGLGVALDSPAPSAWQWLCGQCCAIRRRCCVRPSHSSGFFSLAGPVAVSRQQSYRPRSVTGPERVPPMWRRANGQRENGGEGGIRNRTDSKSLRTLAGDANPLRALLLSAVSLVSTVSLVLPGALSKPTPYRHQTNPLASSTPSSSHDWASAN